MKNTKYMKCDIFKYFEKYTFVKEKTLYMRRHSVQTK